MKWPKTAASAAILHPTFFCSFRIPKDRIPAQGLIAITLPSRQMLIGVLCARAISYARFFARFNARPTLRVSSLFLIGVDLFLMVPALVVMAQCRNCHKPSSYRQVADRLKENSASFDRIVAIHRLSVHHALHGERASRCGAMQVSASRGVSIRFQFGTPHFSIERNAAAYSLSFEKARLTARPSAANRDAMYSARNSCAPRLYRSNASPPRLGTLFLSFASSYAVARFRLALWTIW